MNTTNIQITHTSVCGKYKYNVSDNTVLFFDEEVGTWHASCMEAQWLVEII